MNLNTIRNGNDHLKPLDSSLSLLTLVLKEEEFLRGKKNSFNSKMTITLNAPKTALSEGDGFETSRWDKLCRLNKYVVDLN
ncbi:hypothetical protein GcM1_247088 [Golovinomyces cichoracearum]|uniref:Uncharacterized protein n=1 Tax=Golovinomyces cichoracearum TaxID=62708 RepID=A0A420IDK1_9PEZI|nr:hypothetical protein GcM1_247088 [Golovinomyces cichoracearum]